MAEKTLQRRFEPRTPLALRADAFGGMFPERDGSAGDSAPGPVVTIGINGPLEKSSGYWFASYEQIEARFVEALTAAPKAIVLSIDSPGGVVAGCFELAARIRKSAEVSGTRILAYVSGDATSAAYALACAADEIYLSSETACVGSIGVIAALVSLKRADEMQGVDFTLVTSGARKADGNPAVETSDGAIAATQRSVDKLASVFFEWVAKCRRLDPAMVGDLQAALFHGSEAVALGLADAIADFDQVLAIASAERTAETSGMSKMEDAVEALGKLAESEDEETSAKAKRMLAAMEDEKEDESEDDSAEDEKDDEEASTDDGEEKKALAASVAKMASRVAKLEKEREDGERSRMLSERSDVEESLTKYLATRPIAEVRAVLASIPKRARPAPITTVGATQGSTQTGEGPQLPPEQSRAMRAAMGLIKTERVIQNTPHRMILGVAEPKEG